MSNYAFASVNMRRRNEATHALLNENDMDDILFIQEPWFGRIGTKRSDTEAQGKQVMGGAANPRWTLHYPHFPSSKRAKVMTYIRIHDRDHPFRKNKCRGIVRNDLCAHPSILITDITIGQFYWRTRNFYNDVDDPSCLRSLLELDLDSTIPTLLVGDFNLHSRTWSPPGWTPSHHADRVEEWLATQTFELLSAPGVPTHRGEGGARDSTLDLVWTNYAASLQNTFQGALIDWGGSLGSDHALIRTIATTPHKARANKVDRQVRYDMNISREDWERWGDIVNQLTPSPYISLQSPTDIDRAVDAIYTAFNSACEQTMDRKGAAPGFRARWWNDECGEASRTMQAATTTDERRACNKTLKTAVRSAKRNWADQYITTANIWEVAAWRHGRRSSHIPALIGNNGQLTFDHEEMAGLLSARFFAEESSDIPIKFVDDPEPREPRPFYAFEEGELEEMLKQTKNNSAPGTSGIGWSLLKRGWPFIGELLANIFTACVRLAYHPPRWKEAKVVVIPKPDKADYSLAKAHRPISLLEAMSKLMEKAVAKRMQHDIVAHKLIPANQFGGRMHSSCLDAGITLIHDVQTAHAAGLKAGILLFDVRGFFDNVNHNRLAAILDNLGYAPELVKWARSFLKDRKVCLSFNNVTSDERDQPVGVPQGSPLSPVLSVTYTSSLLHKMRDWNNSSLGMYVDDEILFACAAEWAVVARLLRVRYSVCEEWLRRSGLAIEPDKTEVLFFQKPYERNPPPAPLQLILPDREHSTYYVVRPSENLRYLGFFINRRLKWEPHVRIMCNRARASIKALQVLGNSIRGLSMANWRLVLNAVCLPVLS